jgi:hypothetical protein
VAKLPKKIAEAADAAESSSYEALPPGPYICSLRGVVTDREGKAGPYWVWEFEVAEGEENAGRRFWMNTSLSEKAVWKLKEVFDAFGYTTDSDTDELVGEKVKLIVSTEVQSQGANAGSLRNNVERVLAYDGDDDAGTTEPGY